MTELTLALIQFAASHEPAENVTKAEALIYEAAGKGAQLICLQELFTSIYFPLCPTDDAYFDLAEPVNGPSITRIARLARELGIYILAPIYEEATVGRFFNSAVMLGPDGETIGVARKKHIPRVHIAHDVWGEIDEKHYFEPAHGEYAVWNTSLGNIGVLICHDRHFPEAARLLALQGAEIVLTPSASRGIPNVHDPVDAWLVELRAHAIANMYYVGGVNRVGVEAGERFLGHSVVVDPAGGIVQMAGQDEEVLVTTINLKTVRATRVARGFLRDRRPDTYTGLLR